jgi:hypothetical protein
MEQPTLAKATAGKKRKALKGKNCNFNNYRYKNHLKYP